MIPVGVCTDFVNLPDAHALGFDYMEIPLCELAALPDGDYQDLVRYVNEADVRIYACNRMLPDELSITGLSVSAQALHEYLSRALKRARNLGVRVVSMDCAVSRRVPDGFDFPMAWRQLGNFLRLVQGHANDSGIRIAVEPLRKSLCNLLNLVSEATMMTALLQLSNIGVLANSASMGMASEPLSALGRAKPLLIHVHLECALTRRFPRAGDGDDYQRFLQTLSESGYAGGVSVCAETVSDFNAEAGAALACIRQAMSDSTHKTLEGLVP